MILALMAAIGACAKSDAATGGKQKAPNATRGQAGEEQFGAATAPMEPELARDQTKAVDGRMAGVADRKVIRNAMLRLQIKTYDDARAQIEALVQHSGGFIASADVGYRDGTVTSATFVLRIPVGSHDDVVRQLAMLGKVQAESSQGDDITAQYVDLASRMRNAQALEERLLDLVKTHTGTVGDLLAVETELNRVRGEIEQMQGQLKAWDELVALSTISLSLSTEEVFVSVTKPGVGAQLDRQLRDSSGAMKHAGVSALLGMVALIPWSPLIALAAFLLWRMARRLRQSLLPRAVASSAPPPPAPPAPAAA